MLRTIKTLNWPIVKKIQSKINTTQLTIPMNEIKKIKIKNEKKKWFPANINSKKLSKNKYKNSITKRNTIEPLYFVCLYFNKIHEKNLHSIFIKIVQKIFIFQTTK